MEQISMPILPLVEQKQINADTIISPVTELPEARKLSATPNRSPVDNPSRYNPKANSTLAPGIDPSFGQFAHDISGSTLASNVMHTYPPPQFMNFKTQAQQAQNKGGYNQYPVESTPNLSGQTYPGLQGPPKARGAYVNGQQLSVQPYANGEIHNNANRYPMTPISAIGPHHSNGFTSSPVDSTTYATDTMGSAYFTQEPQAMGNTNGGISDLGMNPNNGMQFNPSAYQGMSYMNPPQHNYPFQG
jgi:hypothetical protein